MPKYKYLLHLQYLVPPCLICLLFAVLHLPSICLCFPLILLLPLQHHSLPPFYMPQGELLFLLVSYIHYQVSVVYVLSLFFLSMAWILFLTLVAGGKVGKWGDDVSRKCLVHKPCFPQAIVWHSLILHIRLIFFDFSWIISITISFIMRITNPNIIGSVGGDDCLGLLLWRRQKIRNSFPGPVRVLPGSWPRVKKSTYYPK